MNGQCYFQKRNAQRTERDVTKMEKENRVNPKKGKCEIRVVPKGCPKRERQNQKK